MKSKFVYTDTKAGVDIDLNTMVQHLAYSLADQLMQAAVRTIEFAVECDDTRLKFIAEAAYENYTDLLNLVKMFQITGVDPYPDERWPDYKKLKKHFHVSYQKMLSQLSTKTKEKIVGRGMHI